MKKVEGEPLLDENALKALIRLLHLAHVRGSWGTSIASKSYIMYLNILSNVLRMRLNLCDSWSISFFI